MPEATPDCVFVYGTLRLHPPHPETDLLRGRSTFLGSGTVRGRLYDFGAFPGAVPSGGPDDVIIGEVHRISEPVRTFALLDAYEGCGRGDPRPQLFRREIVTARLESGPDVECAIYWYVGGTAGGQWIRSGDYEMLG